MIGRTTILSAAASLLFAGGVVSPASAGILDDLHVRIGVNVGYPRPEVRRVWVEPVYETRIERVWVEPAYEDRYERVWREPVFEERIERIWVPDRYDTQREVTLDRYGYRVVKETPFLVEPAHWAEQRTRILVRDGYWDNVMTRVCVSEGHWAEMRRQVLVREGYWAEEVCPPPGPSTRIDIGYDRGRDRHDTRRPDVHRPDRRDDRRDDRSPREQRGRR